MIGLQARCALRPLAIILKALALHDGLLAWYEVAVACNCGQRLVCCRGLLLWLLTGLLGGGDAGHCLQDAWLHPAALIVPQDGKAIPLHVLCTGLNFNTIAEGMSLLASAAAFTYNRSGRGLARSCRVRVKQR